MAKARLHAVVSGRVQGVGFRYFVVELARQLGLTGWVRNTPERAVEVLAEGERGALEALLGHLHQGPRLAHVRGVDETWSDYQGEFDDFRVTW